MLVTPCILRAAEGVVNLFCELREKWMPADAEHNNLRVIKCTTFSLTNADGHLIVGNPPIITTSNPTGENWVQDYFNELKNTDPAERDKHFQGSFEPLTPIPDVQCLSGNHELIEVTLIGSPFRNFICRRCTKRTP
jgi:hypothetical protein